MDSNQVLATVDTRKITKNDVDFVIKGLDPQVTQNVNPSELRRNIVQELINQELFYLDAIENGYDNDEEFTTEIEKMKAGMLKQYAVSKIFREITVSEDEIKDYYEQNKSQFVEPERVKASHILVDSEIKAASILKEIYNGLGFANAAEKYSSCPSKSQGGNLGYFSKGMMVPEFEKVAFETDVYQIGGPVETQFGFHLIQVVDKQPAKPQEFEDAKDQIAKFIFSKKQEEIFFKKINELKGKYTVKMQG